MASAVGKRLIVKYGSTNGTLMVQPQVTSGHPTSIRVGLVTYIVTSDPDDWMRIEHERQVKGYYGHTKHLPQPTIYLNPDAPEDITRMTLWHEIMHALAESTMGAPDWRHLGKSRTDREESVIRQLEAPTLSVLRDNPELVAFLTADA